MLYSVSNEKIRMDIEELKKKLTDNLGEVVDNCDQIMKLEGHVGALSTVVKILIAILNVAEGRATSLNDIPQEQLVYPLPPVKEVEATIQEIEEPIQESEQAVQETEQAVR